MKITHLIFSFTTGGAETMLVDIANEQVKRTEVNIVIINRIYNEALLKKINPLVKVLFINRKESSRSPFPIIKLNVLLLKLDSDVLHCHNHNIVPLLLHPLRKKSVLTLHSTGISTTYLNKYKKLFAISESVRMDVMDRTQIDLKVVYNGISTLLFKIKENYILGSMFNIISVGRLEHLIKGQHLTIEALYILKARGITNIQLDLIGAGSSEQYLKELALKYELSERVNFLGLKDRNYIYTHLKNYDLLIQPSLYEGFGLTVVEGMASKVPVLLSNVDGPMEIIENGKYGYHFQSGNAEDLAKQLDSIIKQYNTKQQQQMVEAAYQHVINNFEILNTAKYYLENY